MPLTDKDDFNDVTKKAIDDLDKTLDLVEKSETASKQSDDGIIDIDIAPAKKTRIRINGDNNSILELNLSDLTIAERLEKGYTKLRENVQKITDIDVENDNLSEKIHEIDKDMRSVIDYIFDTNVSEVCCKDGTMFDLKDGNYRFECILEALTKLYSDTLNKEYNTMKRRIQQHADKYIPQDHKPKASSKKRKEIIQKDE